MKIRVLDLETTGMPEDEGGAAICEVGWQDVVVVGNRGMLEGGPCGTLCNPGRPLTPGARAANHLSDRDLAVAVSPEDALQEAWRGDPQFVCAHRADFEAAFCTPPVPWICTWKVALRVWPDAESWSNQYLRYYLGLELPAAFAMPPHRAAPDAYVTAHILCKALETDRASIEDMVRWSTGPGLLPRVTFGKHKGSRWEDLPRDYLAWIVDKSDMDKDVKANAKYHLRKRAQQAAVGSML
jgi:exodeoxyribonuclease X